MANIRIGRIVDDIWQNILDRINGTEGKVQAEDTVLQGKIDTLNAKDFATSAKQDSIKAVLDAINAKDLSTGAKQDLIKTVLDTLKTDTNTIKGKDFATQTTLLAVVAKLADLETELTTIKANQTDGTAKVQLNGNLEELTTANINAVYNSTMRTPTTGVKTVTATAAEVFAGASRLANRRKVLLKNEDSVLRCRIGSSSVSQQNGFPLEPGATLEMEFEPAVAVPMYAVSEGANLQLAVIEL